MIFVIILLAAAGIYELRQELAGKKYKSTVLYAVFAVLALAGSVLYYLMPFGASLAGAVLSLMGGAV